MYDKTDLIDDSRYVFQLWHLFHFHIQFLQDIRLEKFPTQKSE